MKPEQEPEALSEASDLAPRGSGNQNFGIKFGFQEIFVAFVSTRYSFENPTLAPPTQALKSHLATSEGLRPSESVLIVGLLRLLWDTPS